MKFCKYGHEIGTVESCLACRISVSGKKRWANPTPTMVATAKTNHQKLQSQAAADKRAIYFASDTHKRKASEQAKKLAKERRSGQRPALLFKKYDTKPELAVAAVLETLGIAYRKQEIVGPYAFDFYLHEHKLLIEVDREYFHSRPESIANDLAKESYLKSQCPGINLVRITELDTLKKGFVEKRLKQLLSISPSQPHKVDLTQCVVVNCDINRAIEFMARYHYLPRFRKSTKHIHAVWYNEIIIAIVIYATPSYGTIAQKYGTKSILELARFVIGDNYHVPNLASWTLSRSIRLLASSVDMLVSYADPHFGFNGSIYRAANWAYGGTTKPSYYYLDAANTILHKKTVWDHAKKMGVTEMAYAEANQLRRIESEPKEIFTYVLNRRHQQPSNIPAHVSVNCGRCNHEFSVSSSALARATKKHGHYLCLSCSIANNWSDGVYRGRQRRIEKSDEVIKAVCACGASKTIKLKSYKYAVRHNGVYRCIGCAVKAARRPTGGLV